MAQEARITQAVCLVLVGGSSGVARITQAPALIMQAPVVPLRITQAVALVADPGYRPALLTQAMQLVLAHAEGCHSTRSQIWTITRRDGVVLGFTSHDRPIWRFGRVYSPCRSLDPSASENASTLGSVGSIELTGIIDSDAISEADLFAGKYDDAFVEVDLVDWSDASLDAHRIASGWTGELSQGQAGFSMEVLGGGVRLAQQGLVQMMGPGCRWVFGDPKTCKVDRQALKMTATIVSATTRGAFSLTLSGDGAGRQWQNGALVFTSGANSGQLCEIKALDLDAGIVSLWSPASFLPVAGDTVDVLPGCDLSKTGGCSLYANIINFGGFPDVPGSDSLLETPEAKY